MTSWRPIFGLPKKKECASTLSFFGKFIAQTKSNVRAYLEYSHIGPLRRMTGDVELQEMTNISRFSSAARASAFHFSLSILVALLTAILVFHIWYPWPLYELVTGRELFRLVVGVDVVCGPLLTLVLWNPAKPRRELTMDLSLVAAVQIIALAYGMYTVAIARPVHLVFETDRLRVVTASEIEAADLPQAPPGLRDLPWTGPTLISLRAPRDSQELVESIDLSAAGKEPSLRPGWWQSYDLGLPQLLQRAKPVAQLAQVRHVQKPLLEEAVHKSGVSAKDLLWLPLTSAKSMEWIVLLDKNTGIPRGYAPIDGFF